MQTWRKSRHGKRPIESGKPYENYLSGLRLENEEYVLGGPGANGLIKSSVLPELGLAVRALDISTGASPAIKSTGISRITGRRRGR